MTSVHTTESKSKLGIIAVLPQNLSIINGGAECTEWKLSPDGLWLVLVGNHRVTVRGLTADKTFVIEAPYVRARGSGFLGNEYVISASDVVRVFETTGWTCVRSFDSPGPSNYFRFGASRMLAILLAPDDDSETRGMIEYDRLGNVIRSMPWQPVYYIDGTDVLCKTLHSGDFVLGEGNKTKWAHLDGGRVCDWGRDAVGFARHGKIVVRDIVTGERLFTVSIPHLEAFDFINTAFSPRGRVAVTGEICGTFVSPRPLPPTPRRISAPVEPESYAVDYEHRHDPDTFGIGLPLHSLSPVWVPETQPPFHWHSTQSIMFFAGERLCRVVESADYIVLMSETRHWCKSIHPYLAQKTRDRILTLLLCGVRARGVGSTLPGLPLEVWETVLGFVDVLLCDPE